MLDDRQAFLATHARSVAAVERRDETLLRQPCTPADVVAHRLVHRPHVRLPSVEAVERRTALLHLERLACHGPVVPADDGYVAV